MNIFKRFWRWIKSLGRKKLPTTPLSEVFTVEVKPPEKRKLTVTGRKQKKQHKSTKLKHSLHYAHFGTFKPRKPLPKFIIVGLNRQNSIDYSNKVMK